MERERATETKGKQKKKMAPSGGGGDPAVIPALDRGHLVGLRSRPDLNGRRVEVKGPAAGKDGAPRLAVRLLFGAGAGTVLKVKAANLELDKARGMDDPAMAPLVAALALRVRAGSRAERPRRAAAGTAAEEAAAVVPAAWYAPSPRPARPSARRPPASLRLLACRTHDVPRVSVADREELDPTSVVPQRTKRR